MLNDQYFENINTLKMMTCSYIRLSFSEIARTRRNHITIPCCYPLLLNNKSWLDMTGVVVTLPTREPGLWRSYQEAQSVARLWAGVRGRGGKGGRGDPQGFIK